MIINLYVLDGATPKNSSVAIIKGLIYKDVPASVGIQSSSILTIAFTASTKYSSGKDGIQSL